MSDDRYGPIALREDAVSNTQVPANDDDDEEEAHEFATYVESDDDDEDPYFMPEHNRKSSTLSFSRLTCSPVQLFRFFVPTFCILIIFVYTIVIAVLTHQRKAPTPPTL
ncbi:predicted protein [Lichtheimia corymbifera JMRC:FSU:9682]|uniref:Uncharacterized protein n=1 Tax=Lichtheimia corymbifera JMRC:FSU:9682 TaxID=1263082 RepID=A0A068RS12_9FUNG|nr:predicted protein [Lichtheimia corymbifera JMRC:FSU:9682]